MTTNNAIKKINLAIDEIERAISNYDKFSSFTTINQLDNFKAVLMKTKYLIESENIPHESQRYLGMSRVIIDQWPFDSELGRIIIDAESAYNSI
jgi:hypothetical protein